MSQSVAATANVLRYVCESSQVLPLDAADGVVDLCVRGRCAGDIWICWVHYRCGSPWCFQMDKGWVDICNVELTGTRGSTTYGEREGEIQLLSGRLI